MKSAFVTLIASALLIVPASEAGTGLTNMQRQILAQNDTSMPAVPNRIAITHAAVSFELKWLCYLKHANLIDKPAARTIERCWGTHGHLMT